MKIYAVGSKAFVTGFVLAGVNGVYVTGPKDALEKVNKLINEKDVGLIILSEDVSREIRNELSDIRSRRAVPLIYEVPGPTSKPEKVEYRAMLRQILGV